MAHAFLSWNEDLGWGAGVVEGNAPSLHRVLGPGRDEEKTAALRRLDRHAELRIRFFVDDGVRGGRLTEGVTFHPPGAVGFVAVRVKEGPVVEGPHRRRLEHRARDFVRQDGAALKVADPQGEAVRAVPILLPGVKPSIGRNGPSSETVGCVLPGAFVEVQQHHFLPGARRGEDLIGPVRSPGFPANEGVLFPGDVPAVVEPIAFAVGNAGVLLDDAGFHLLDELVSQFPERGENLVEIGILRVEVGAHSGVIALAHPEKVVVPLDSVDGVGVAALFRERRFGGSRERGDQGHRNCGKSGRSQ